jgi:hypothetical protein
MDSDSFVLGAFGMSDSVFQTSSNPFEAHENNGLFWYNYATYSFGFSAVSDIELNPMDISSENSQSRLSWVIDQDLGGYRIGSICQVYGDNEIEFLIQGSGLSARQVENNCNDVEIFTKSIYKTIVHIAPPAGVLRNFPLSLLERRKMKLCYSENYEDSAKLSDILNCQVSGSW